MPFDKEARQIYRYNNGTKEVAGDPLAIYNRLTIALGSGNLDHYHKLLKMRNEDSCEALEKLIEASRKAFRVEEFSEEDGEATGLMDMEVLDLLVNFLAWTKDLKKKQENLLPSVKHGESESPLGEAHRLTRIM